jgi:hypothetical protein
MMNLNANKLPERNVHIVARDHLLAQKAAVRAQVLLSYTQHLQVALLLYHILSCAHNNQ